MLSARTTSPALDGVEHRQLGAAKQQLPLERRAVQLTPRQQVGGQDASGSAV